MKFTEEQFKKLVEIQEDNYSHDLYWGLGKDISETVRRDNLNLHNFIDENDLENKAVALMNLLTREWAHDKFVEKEKKYVWTSKKANSSGKNKRLFWQMSSKSVRDYFTIDENAFDDSELLTESEIKEWGYNPEMFDREEVQ